MKTRTMLLLSLLAAPWAMAEDVEHRAKLPSELTRIRGASSVARVPWGYVALGGSMLRHLPKGSAQWVTLHKEPGLNLYRIAANEKGQLLASWENQDDFHLFVPATKEHRKFPKPAKPEPGIIAWALDDIYFDDNGDALVYMNGLVTSNMWCKILYRYPLDGKSKPVELFRQPGHELLVDKHLAIFAYSKNRSRGCDYNACSPLNGIYAYEIKGNKATRRVLLETDEEKYIIARTYFGSGDKRVAIQIFDNKNGRHMLRWNIGETKVTMRPLARGPSYDIERHWMMRNGDVIETWKTSDYLGLEVWRHSLDGRTKITTFPMGNKRLYWDTTVYGLKERAKGGLAMQWGNRLIFLEDGKEPRWYDLGTKLKRGNEWGGAFLYQPDPEAVWIGIDIPGGRDYVYVTFDEAEKKSKPFAGVTQGPQKRKK